MSYDVTCHQYDVPVAFLRDPRSIRSADITTIVWTHTPLSHYRPPTRAAILFFPSRTWAWSQSTESLVTRLECDRWRTVFFSSTTPLHLNSYSFRTVRGLLGRFWQFVIMVMIGGMVVAMLVMECLQWKSPVGLLPAPSPFGNVRVILAHCLRFINLELGV